MTIRRRSFCFVPVLVMLVLAAVVPSAFAGNAYVANALDDTVSVVDTQTNAVVGSPIPVGDEPEAIAITPDGKTVYAVNNESESVSAIDTGTNRVVSTIRVGDRPTAIAITPDGKTAYVVNFESATVSVIDTRTNQVVGAPIPVGSRPSAIAIAPDGKLAYVASGNAEGAVATIDTATNRVVGMPITVEPSPSAIAITPDGKIAYVTHGVVAGAVSVIDIQTRAVGTPIAVERAPSAIAITPDGKVAYVVNAQTQNVSVIDTRMNQVVGSPIPVGLNPTAIAITPDGRTAYVPFGNSLSVIDTRINQAVGGPIPVGGEAAAIAVTPDQDPLASLTAARARPGVPVAFDASASKDPDGSIVRYGWTFGDGQGTVTTSPGLSHTYGSPGRYGATLTAADGEACSAGLVFTGQTAYCRGSAPATLEVKVAYPGVRVGCPRRVKPFACTIRLQVVTKRRRGKATSTVAGARLKAGHSKIVSLKPKPAFKAELARADRVLVRMTVKIGSSKRIRYQPLKIVR
jgi:YVTN family beta-propeller protein